MIYTLQAEAEECKFKVILSNLARPCLKNKKELGLQLSGKVFRDSIPSTHKKESLRGLGVYSPATVDTLANRLHCSTPTEKVTITMPPFFFCKDGQMDTQFDPWHNSVIAYPLGPCEGDVQLWLQEPVETSPLWVFVNRGISALVWVDISWL